MLRDDSSLVAYVILAAYLAIACVSVWAKVIVNSDNDDSPVLKVIYGNGNAHYFTEKGQLPQASDGDYETCVDISENIAKINSEKIVIIIKVFLKMALYVNGVNVTTSGGGKGQTRGSQRQKNFYIRGRYYGNLARFSTSSFNLLCPWPELEFADNDLDLVDTLRDPDPFRETTAFELVYETRNRLCEIEVDVTRPEPWWAMKSSTGDQEAPRGGDGEAGKDADSGNDAGPTSGNADAADGAGVGEGKDKSGKGAGILEGTTRQDTRKEIDKSKFKGEGAKEWLLQRDNFVGDSRWQEAWDEYYDEKIEEEKEEKDKGENGGDIREGNHPINGLDKGTSKKKVGKPKGKYNSGELGSKEVGYSGDAINELDTDNSGDSALDSPRVGFGIGEEILGKSSNDSAYFPSGTSSGSDDQPSGASKWTNTFIPGIQLNTIGNQGDTRIFPHRIRYQNGSHSTRYDACHENRLFDATPHGITLSPEDSNCIPVLRGDLCLSFKLEKSTRLVDLGIYVRDGGVQSVFVVERDFTRKPCKLTSDSKADDPGSTGTTQQLWYRCSPARKQAVFIEMQLRPRENLPKEMGRGGRHEEGKGRGWTGDEVRTDINSTEVNTLGESKMDNSTIADNDTMSDRSVRDAALLANVSTPHFARSIDETRGNVPPPVASGSLSIVELVVLSRQDSDNEEKASARDWYWNRRTNGYLLIKISFMVSVLLVGVVLAIYIVRVEYRWIARNAIHPDDADDDQTNEHPQLLPVNEAINIPTAAALGGRRQKRKSHRTL